MDIKEFDLIYAMGCSWVQGCELNGDILELKPYERIENRFTEVLQEWTNIEFVNDAVGAGGNDKIVRRTFEFVKLNPNKKILVILGLTGIDRQEIWTPIKQEWSKLNLCNGKDIFYMVESILSTTSSPLTTEEKEVLLKAVEIYLIRFYDEHKIREKVYRELSMLSAYIKNTNSFNEVIIFSSLGDSLKGIKHDLNYMTFDGTEWSEFINRDRARTARYTCSGGHPNEEAHKILAEKILDYVHNNLTFSN
jgi:hypothetical protein